MVFHKESFGRNLPLESFFTKKRPPAERRVVACAHMYNATSLRLLDSVCQDSKSSTMIGQSSPRKLWAHAGRTLSVRESLSGRVKIVYQYLHNYMCARRPISKFSNKIQINKFFNGAPLSAGTVDSPQCGVDSMVHNMSHRMKFAREGNSPERILG